MPGAGRYVVSETSEARVSADSSAILLMIQLFKSPLRQRLPHSVRWRQEP